MWGGSVSWGLCSLCTCSMIKNTDYVYIYSSGASVFEHGSSIWAIKDTQLETCRSHTGSYYSHKVPTSPGTWRKLLICLSRCWLMTSSGFLEFGLNMWKCQKEIQRSNFRHCVSFRPARASAHIHHLHTWFLCYLTEDIINDSSSLSTLGPSLFHCELNPPILSTADWVTRYKCTAV